MELQQKNLHGYCCDFTLKAEKIDKIGHWYAGVVYLNNEIFFECDLLYPGSELEYAMNEWEQEFWSWLI